MHSRLYTIDSMLCIVYSRQCAAAPWDMSHDISQRQHGDLYTIDNRLYTICNPECCRMQQHAHVYTIHNPSMLSHATTRPCVYNRQSTVYNAQSPMLLHATTPCFLYTLHKGLYTVDCIPRPVALSLVHCAQKTPNKCMYVHAL